MYLVKKLLESLLSEPSSNSGARPSSELVADQSRLADQITAIDISVLIVTSYTDTQKKQSVTLMSKYCKAAFRSANKGTNQIKPKLHDGSNGPNPKR